MDGSATVILNEKLALKSSDVVDAASADVKKEKTVRVGTPGPMTKKAWPTASGQVRSVELHMCSALAMVMICIITFKIVRYKYHFFEFLKNFQIVFFNISFYTLQQFTEFRTFSYLLGWNSQAINAPFSLPSRSPPPHHHLPKPSKQPPLPTLPNHNFGEKPMTAHKN